MKIRGFQFLLLLTLALHTVLAQEEKESIGEAIDRVSFDWDTQAVELEYYAGLTKFCKDAEYRTSIIELMSEIHHFDSLLYEKALVAQSRSDDKEIKKLIKEIEGFEGKYSFHDFIHFLKEECDGLKKLEKNSEDLNTATGEESLDGQIYIIEVEMQRYVKHLTKRVDHIRKHVHHLHIK
ncbi:MAG: alkyl hydroperoxide reductase subunit AhpF [Cyclobacteriaceae bacterium]|jgi:alkyl hydroperoxide reductase subunit AhpF